MSFPPANLITAEYINIDKQNFDPSGLAGLSLADQTALSNSIRRSSLMILGTSLSSYGTSLRNVLLPTAAMINTPAATYTNINASGILVRNIQFDLRYTPTGAGTLRYYTDQTMTWQSFGDLEGARTSVADGGSVYLPSYGAGGAYVQLTIGGKPNVNAADAITVAATVVNAWCNTNGYSGAWELLKGNPFDVTYNFGISGATTTDILRYRRQWESVFTAVTFIEAGVNDNPTISTLATSLANMRAIIAARIAIGSIPVVLLPPPNGVDTLAVKQLDLDFNFQMALYCNANGIKYVDSYAQLNDWTTLNSAVRANCFGADNLHTSSMGAFLWAKYGLAPVADSLITTQVQRYSAVSTYNAVNAPRGNLLVNGGLIGTGGTAGAGNNASPSVPANWSVARTVGANITFQSTSPSDGAAIARATDGIVQPWWNIDINNSTGGANENITIFQTAFLSGANIVAGDILRMLGELMFSGTGIASISVQFIGTNTTYRVFGATSGYDFYNIAGETIQVTYKSRDFVIPSAGLANMNVQINVTMQAAGVMNLKLGPMFLGHTP